MLFQHLPEGEEGRERIHTKLDHPDWPHVAVLAGSVKDAELLDRELALDELVWRLFHEEEEVRILPAVALSRGCRCNPDYVRSVIARFPAEEQAAMVGDDGLHPRRLPVLRDRLPDRPGRHANNRSSS